MSTDTKPTVLIVDDAPDNLMLIKMLLAGKYRVKLALNGEIALRAAEQQPLPDLILLDVMMPDMDGYQVCRQLKANPVTRNIPVLFLTAKNHLEDQRRGFQEGALDYVTKPIDPEVLQARVATHLQLKALRSQMQDQNQQLDQLTQIQDATILAVAAMVETGDNATRNHLRRTQHYVAAIAKQMQQQDKYAESLSDSKIALIFKAVPLHDIGKVGSNDPSLRNPGRLTEEEVQLMRQHTIFGRDSILGVEQYLGISNPFLQYARQICYSHQERYDGSGYPEGLAGEAIPLAARIMAVADVYDALITRKSYKEAKTHAEAMALLRAGRDQQFDPDVLDAFCAVEARIVEIAEQFKDFA